MDDRRITQIIDGALEMLKTLLAGARSDDPHAKQSALARAEKIVKGLKP